MAKVAKGAVSGSIDVTTLHETHPRIRAKDWRSPLVLRLLQGPKYRDGQRVMTGSFRPVEGAEVSGALHLRWEGLGDDFKQCVNTYQEPVLTEFATLGLACVLLTNYTSFSISEVTRRGERVDYWIGDDQNRKRFVLEVGGQQNGPIDGLSTSKTTQLQDNPWKRPGFICVAVFAEAAARLWFCGLGGEA